MSVSSKAFWGLRRGRQKSWSQSYEHAITDLLSSCKRQNQLWTVEHLAFRAGSSNYSLLGAPGSTGCILILTRYGYNVQFMMKLQRTPSRAASLKPFLSALGYFHFMGLGAEPCCFLIFLYGWVRCIHLALRAQTLVPNCHPGSSWHVKNIQPDQSFFIKSAGSGSSSSLWCSLYGAEQEKTNEWTLKTLRLHSLHVQ